VAVTDKGFFKYELQCDLGRSEEWNMETGDIIWRKYTEF